MRQYSERSPPTRIPNLTQNFYTEENCNCSKSKRTKGEHFYNENGHIANHRNVATYSPNHTRSHDKNFYFFFFFVFGELSLNNPLKVTFVVSDCEGLNCHIPGCHKARPCSWSPQFQKNLPPPVNAYREVLFFPYRQRPPTMLLQPGTLPSLNYKHNSKWP